ncbi:hypothetical protein ACFWMV_04965 [Streptomyces mutabilis]|uniref:hypothetical protein n=1 Tax=Streptomyces mutabilis TaxID=67332 RepID=UPI003666DDB6
MTDEQSLPTGTLTDLQRTRIDFARRELDSARAEDLAQLDAAGLILMVERLRGRLGDVLDLIDEITEQP